MTPLKISSNWIAELTQKSEGVLKQTCKLFVRMVMDKNRREKREERVEKNGRDCEIIILLYEPAAEA